MLIIPARAYPPREIDAQAALDIEVFAQLTEHLDRHGVSWVLLNREPSRPWLLVNSAHSFGGTYISVGRHPVLRLPAIYGYGTLYLGTTADLRKVAARLSYLIKNR